jgi:hypothetical protein
MEMHRERLCAAFRCSPKQTRIENEEYLERQYSHKLDCSADLWLARAEPRRSV